MPEEITQSQARKRKDRKKTKGKESSDRFSLKNDDDDEPLSKFSKGYKDDDEFEDSLEEVDSHSHGHSSGGLLSTAVFLILLSGLIFLTALIYIELKDSKEVSTVISESRYASILGDFVEEPTGDEHDEEHLEKYDADCHLSDGDGHEHEDDHGYVDEEHGHVEEEHGHVEEEHGHVEEEHGHIEEEHRHIDKEHGHVEEDHVNIKEERVHVEEDEEQVEHQENLDQEEQHEKEEEKSPVFNVEEKPELEDSTDQTDEDEFATSEFEVEQQAVELESDFQLEVEGSLPTINDEELDQSNDEGLDFNNFEEETSENSESQEIERDQRESNSENTEHNGKESNSEPENLDFENVIHDEVTEQPLIQDEENEYQNAESPNENNEEKGGLTNEYDENIREDLEKADEEIEKSLERSLRMYESILVGHPFSPRATFGRAKCLDKLSEQKKSNALLDECIRVYRQVLTLPDVSDQMFRLAAERGADRMKFRGFTSQAAAVEKMLIQRFPDDMTIQNSLAVTNLQMGNNGIAKQILEHVLSKCPDNGFAKVHYGFILKTEDSNYKEAIKYLSEGIATEEEGTIDGRFFFHLGDALARIGQIENAYKVYENGVQKKVFRSVYQRSLYNVDHLTARPWWSLEQTTYQHHLNTIENSWEIIKREALSLLDVKKERFLPESEGLKDTGVWKQYELFARGRKVSHNCERVPFTCRLVENIKNASGCTRGQIKFSIMLPGTHIWAHTGPTNCRLRAHLGLVVPDGVRIRVANQTRTWKEGKFIIFDDSFEHEVWHEGNSMRLVLIVDFWHPELSEQLKRSLTPI